MKELAVVLLSLLALFMGGCSLYFLLVLFSIFVHDPSVYVLPVLSLLAAGGCIWLIRGLLKAPKDE